MHVFISIDMEGVAGVAHRGQVNREGSDYPAARGLMTDEASAAVRGAFTGGATRVVVNDSHGDMANLLPHRLDPRAELLIGSPKAPDGMLQSLTPDFAVALFIGYHARAGTESAVLDHTYSGATVYDLRVNDEPWGEIELNAALAGSMNVPVGLVTGDQQACAQAAAALGPGGTDVAIVKQAGGRSQATSLHPQVACERIEAAAAAAVARRDLKPFTPPSPYTLAIDFMQTAMAEMAALVPGAERTGPRRVTYRSDNIAEVARCRVALTTLAASVHQRP